MSQSLVPSVFTFTDQSVRVVVIDDSPWFVAADVCAALTIGNSRETLNRLDEDEKGVSSIDTLKGPQELGIINESGLYSLVLGSRKPEAKKFKKWVTSEVLPAIRKTGSYSVHASTRPGLTNEQLNELALVLRGFSNGWLFTAATPQWAYNHLRQVFQVNQVQDIPAEHFETALTVLRAKEVAADQFRDAVIEARTWFDREVMGGGAAWTPAIKRKLAQQLKGRITLPAQVDWKALADQTKPVVTESGEQS